MRIQHAPVKPLRFCDLAYGEMFCLANLTETTYMKLSAKKLEHGRAVILHEKVLKDTDTSDTGRVHEIDPGRCVIRIEQTEAMIVKVSSDQSPSRNADKE